MTTRTAEGVTLQFRAEGSMFVTTPISRKRIRFKEKLSLGDAVPNKEEGS